MARDTVYPKPLAGPTSRCRRRRRILRTLMNPPGGKC